MKDFLIFSAFAVGTIFSLLLLVGFLTSIGS